MMLNYKGNKRRTYMIKVAVDAFGGDNSPYATVKGAVEALKELSDLEVILVGDEKTINKELENLSFDKSRLSILHASEVIDCNEKPTDAIRTKKDSSLMKAVELLKSSDDINAMVSTGSTGAILAAAVLKIGRIKGVKRPGLCPILPTTSGKIIGVCDCGANTDCDALQLSQFAVMGSLYLHAAFGIENPRVALSNIGTEEEKGDALRKETYAILKEMKNINFTGNIEARELLKGNADLVVTDGFSGNILIKATEGAALETMKLVKKALVKNLKTKIGALFIKKDLYKVKDLMDYNNYGGAVLLGTAKTVVKGHGSSNETAVKNCVLQAYKMEKNNLRQAIATAMQNV